ncbi:MAG: dynamin family protein [Desulfatibacillum sp.]|nr:dynamin family protein [Desulfatibacillum sp.]
MERYSMDSFDTAKQTLIEAGKDLNRLFETAVTLPGISTNPFESWLQTLNTMKAQMAEGVLRVAVVGSIKSGKSTFVNSFFGGDFVKRGAGVVTCIVTRIRQGEKLGATLYLKSWDEVNAEIEQAMVLFPAFNWRGADGKIDIRRQTDREKLGHALELLGDDQLITQGTINMNAVLITSYLQGFEKIKDLMDAQSASQKFDAAHFASHKDFVGNESLAVYLKDVILSLPDGKGVEDQVEVADCQGSDSPNPMHLAMIEDYLLKTHFIIYVISSRTGVRQADIRFLSLIKKMGLASNIYFVINCDFSEHEAVSDLRALLERITQEISLLRPDPEVFCFSSLFNLFSGIKDELNDKDLARLGQWELDSDMRRFSDYESKRFLEILEKRLTRDRLALLLKSHVDRVAMMVSGVGDWINISRDFVSRNAEQAAEVVRQMAMEKEGVDRIRAMVRNTLDGAMRRARVEVGQDVDRFFDPSMGPAITELWEFIRQYQPAQTDPAPASFTNAVYAVFSDLKRAVDRHMAEQLNPALAKFVRDEEAKISKLVNEIARPYGTMVDGTLSRYEKTLGDMGITLADRKMSDPDQVDVARVRRLAGIQMPGLTAAMRYSAKVRTEAVMRKGAYSAGSFIKRLFNKESKPLDRNDHRAITHALARMKEETRQSLEAHFMDFRENLKFQYMFKLLDLSAVTLQEDLADRLKVFVEGMEQTTGLVNENQAAKEDAREILAKMEERRKEIETKVASAGKLTGL